jgi:signal transduction histidine kinase
VLIGLIQVVGTRIAASGQLDARPLGALAYVLLLAGPAALLLRRPAPAVAYGIAAAATLGYALSPYPRGPFVFAGIVALFGAVRAGKRVAAGVVTVLGYLAFVFAGRIWGGDLYVPSVTQSVLLAVALAFLLLLAESARIRGEQFAQMARIRSEQARARAEQERRQASEERLRIARELHDVIGHHLSLINVQAGVGLHLMDTQPDQARSSLAAIKQASAEALREVRSVLGALHADDDETAPRAPAPSLGRVTELVESAGLPVRLTVEGVERPLPPEVDRAAYRIVQEALTNVRRHAGPGASATVTIGYGDGALIVRVDDNGLGALAVPSTGDEAAGAGVPGMRERATALGGTFVAGPGPEGGFRVEVKLPVKGAT